MHRLIMFSFVSLLCICEGASPTFSRDITISLRGVSPTKVNSEVYSLITQISNTSSLVLKILDVPLQIKFLIIQAHSYQREIVASYDPVLTLHNHANGTNLGLVYEQNILKNCHIFNYDMDSEVQVYISVHAYLAKAPIPGGCNMEFNVLNAPYLRVSEDFHMITVEASPGRVATKEDCDAESQKITHDFYHMYMPEWDHSSNTYFDMLKRMITVEKILKNGKQVPKPISIAQMRRLFSAYHGTGSVYAVIATNAGYSSAYVPNHSYASSIYNGHIPLYMKIIFPILSIIGLLICMCGHCFYRTQIVIFGYVFCSTWTFILTSNFVTLPIEVSTWVSILVGVLLLSVFIVFLFFVLVNWMSKAAFLFNCIFTYTILSMVVELPFTVVFTISAIAGVISTLTWLMCLGYFGIDLCTVILSSFCAGFQFATISLFGMPDGNPLLHNNLNFWAFFLFITFIIMLCCMPLVHLANVFACSVIGGFTALVTVELILGSYLRYMFVNIIRRSSVLHFNDAVIDPPYQWRDGVATFIWFLLFGIGFTVQWFITKGTEPFPSHGNFPRFSFFPTRTRNTETAPFVQQHTNYSQSYGSFAQPTGPSAYYPTAPPYNDHTGNVALEEEVVSPGFLNGLKQIFKNNNRHRDTSSDGNLLVS